MQDIEFDDSQGAMDAPEAPEQEPVPTPETQDEAAQPPEAPQEPEKPSLSFSDDQQAFINGLMKEQKQRTRDLESKYQQQMQEMEQRLQSVPKPTDDGPVVPDMPSGWEENYEQLVQERDQKLIERAQWEAQEQSRKQQAEQDELRQAQEKQQEFLQSVQTYTERAEALGIDGATLQAAGGAVQTFGISDELTNFILREEQGPALTVYLSKNFQELQALKSMNSMDAAIHIATQIKPRVARSLKRQAPPEPIDTPQGSGFPEGEKGLKGAVYE